MARCGRLCYVQALYDKVVRRISICVACATHQWDTCCATSWWNSATADATYLRWDPASREERWRCRCWADIAEIPAPTGDLRQSTQITQTTYIYFVIYRLQLQWRTHTPGSIGVFLRITKCKKRCFCPSGTEQTVTNPCVSIAHGVQRTI